MQSIFVAMPFDYEFWDVWEVIESAAKEACANAIRIDMLPDVENIFKRILLEIEK